MRLCVDNTGKSFSLRRVTSLCDHIADGIDDVRGITNDSSSLTDVRVIQQIFFRLVGDDDKAHLHT